MTKRLILHIGSPKTGSTPLQCFLSRNQSRLLKSASILYPNSGRIGWAHHNIAYEYGGKHLQSKFKLGCGGLLDVLSEFRLSTASTLLLSSEAFFHYGRESYLRLVENLGSLEINVMFFLRRQEEYLQSGYQQIHKYARVLDMPLEFGIRKKNIANYHLLIDKLTVIFGCNSVFAIPYLNRDTGFDVRQSFCSSLGIATNSFDFSLPPCGENASLDIHSHTFFRYLFSSGQASPSAGLPTRLVSDVHAFARNRSESNVKYTFLDQYQSDLLRMEFRHSNGKLHNLLKECANSSVNLLSIPAAPVYGLPEALPYSPDQKRFFAATARRYGYCFDQDELPTRSLFSTPVDR
jgi:hypothetical protein